MTECFVIVDVGCIECGEETEVIGVFCELAAARAVFDEMARDCGETPPADEPGEDEPLCFSVMRGGQHSVELHRGVPFHNNREETN